MSDNVHPIFAPVIAALTQGTASLKHAMAGAPTPLAEAAGGDYDARLQRVLSAGRVYYAARQRFIFWTGSSDENERLLAALDAARNVFHDACESYFLNSAECGS